MNKILLALAAIVLPASALMLTPGVEVGPATHFNDAVSATVNYDGDVFTVVVTQLDCSNGEGYIVIDDVEPVEFKLDGEMLADKLANHLCWQKP